MKLGIEENVVGCPEETTVLNTKEFVETLLAIEECTTKPGRRVCRQKPPRQICRNGVCRTEPSRRICETKPGRRVCRQVHIPIESVTEDHDKSEHGYLAEMFVVMFPTQNMYVEMLQDIEMKVSHVKDPLKYPTM